MDTIKHHVFDKVGGPRVVAEWCGIHPSQCSRWEVIPAKHQITILERARAEGIDLKPADFFKRPAPSDKERAA